MSSGLQFAVGFFRLVNCSSVVLITVVVHDYCITFPREVEYIWCRSWTWVSSLFLMVRYLGICLAILVSFMASTLFPASAVNQSTDNCTGTTFYLVNQFVLLIFNAAIELVMIMRIYAMWGRSKIILGLLLCIFVPHVIISFVFAAIFDDPNTYMSVTTTQILDIQICNFTYNLPSPYWTYTTAAIALSVVLLILPIIRILKESVDMYKATEKWQPNRYMKLFVRDGIFYFFVRSLHDIQQAIPSAGRNQMLWALFTDMLSLTLMYSVLPRFIINIRELYDRDVRCCLSAIDTGFGVFSHSRACENTTVSAIAFADVCTHPEDLDQNVEEGTAY